MNSPIFARTRHTYDSYTDYWRLVGLSDFPTCYVDEIDAASDNVYIVTPFNEEWEAGWQGARARIILYDLEWHVDNFPHVPGVSEVWAADKWYADKIGAKYVPLGSHVGLAQGYDNPPANGAYDYALLAYMTNRRAAIVLGCTVDGEYVAGLREEGLSIAPNGWGQSRHDALRDTRLMLHVHQHDHVQTCAPQRFALAAAYELPLLTETLADRGIFSPSYVLMSDYRYIPRMAKQWVAQSPILNDYALALHNLLCRDKTFRINIEAAL